MGVLILGLLSRAAIAIGAITFLLTGSAATVVVSGVIAVLSVLFIAKWKPEGSSKRANLICAVADTLLVFLFVPLFFQANWEWWFLLGTWLVSSFVLGRGKVINTTENRDNP
jgi:hypothetical protein